MTASTHNAPIFLGLNKAAIISIVVAAAVLGMYATLAIVAANQMVTREVHRQTQNPKAFKAITVKQPISFLDKTYMTKEKPNP